MQYLEGKAKPQTQHREKIAGRIYEFYRYLYPFLHIAIFVGLLCMVKRNRTENCSLAVTL